MFTNIRFIPTFTVCSDGENRELSPLPGTAYSWQQNVICNNCSCHHVAMTKLHKTSDTRLLLSYYFVAFVTYGIIMHVLVPRVAGS